MVKRFSVYGLLLIISLLAPGTNAQEAVEGKWKMTGYRFANKMTFPTEEMVVNLTVRPNLQIGGKAACNTYAGKLTISPGGKLTVGPLISTEMACDEIKMKFENLFLRTLESASRYTIEKETFTITNPQTKSFLRFERSQPAAPANRQILFVHSKTARCEGIAPMKCMRIKKGTTGAWQNFYDSIIGFDFRPGRFYKIEVERQELVRGPNDTNIYRYRLVRVIKTVTKERHLYS